MCFSSKIDVTGATVLGTVSIDGKQTMLLRVTEAGLKLIRLTGTGAAQVRVSLAGDLNRDGVVDGADSAAWEQAAGDGDVVGDLNGDGVVTQADRQVLYANYGWQANRAPVANAQLSVVRTHTDLTTEFAVDSVATDFEDDAIFWTIQRLEFLHCWFRWTSSGEAQGRK